MKYGAGVIDSGYRGEIFIAITNTNHHPVVIYKNENEKDTSIFRDLFGKMCGNDVRLYPYNKAIAQLIVHNVVNMDEKEISYEELKAIPSKRGGGRLGSSGK